MLESYLEDLEEEALVSERAEIKGEEPHKYLTKGMLTLLLALAFKYGRGSEDMGIKLVNTVKPYVPLERYQISDKLHNEYGEAITELSASFHGVTLDKVNALIKQAKTEEWHKEELASRLREVMTAQRWRVERLARTETHRARGLGQVDAMVSLQNKAQVRITKTWQTVSDKPCEFCLEMAGRTVNVADSYLKTGEAVSGGGSNLFINDYKNINTSLLHPNCTCIERFKVTEVEASEKPKSILESTPEKVVNDLTAEEKAFIYDFERNGYKIDKVISKDYETFKPTNDFIINGLEWEMKTPEKSLKYSTMSTHIRNAIKQNKENFIINLQGKYYSEKALRQLSDYNSRNPSHKLKNLIIYKQGEIIQLIGGNSINKK